jgi:hypothetical protein
MKRPLRVHFLMGMYAWCVAGVEGVLVTINLVVGVVVAGCWFLCWLLSLPVNRRRILGNVICGASTGQVDNITKSRRQSREEFGQIVHYNYSHRVRIHKTNRIRGALVDTSQTPPHETGNNSCPNAINCSTEAVEATALSIVRETVTTLSDLSHHRCTDRVDKRGTTLTAALPSD